REAERATRLKSEFLASMSHELRTPLHTIIGFSELLIEEQDGQLNPKQVRFTNLIHKDSLHLLDLINDILDLTKIEAGVFELRKEVFDMAAAIDEVISSIRPQAEAKRIHLEANNAAHAMLSADPRRFKQILFNLLGNALKFTPEDEQIALET